MEIKLLNYRGHQIRAHLEHRDAVGMLEAVDLQVPAIPAGCNTVQQFFITASGMPAVAVNQSGFSPKASDDEQQVNGCIVFVLLDSLSFDAARHALESFVEEAL